MQYNSDMLRHLRRTIGENIHSARIRHKMPLKKLARISGVTEEKLDLYELGKCEITLDELLRIGFAIGASPLALLESWAPAQL